MHFVKKKEGSVRIVGDMVKLNSMTKRPAYPMSTPADIMVHIPLGSRFFSAFDASSGYWQVPLDLTCFAIKWG